jgi:membrane protease YdiL (CAAX protease family)
MQDQRLVRTKALKELILVMGLAAFVYGIGYFTDTAALGLLSIAVAWAVARTLLRQRRSGWYEYGYQRPRRWKRTAAVALLGVAALHVLVWSLKPLIVEHVTGTPLDISRFEAVRGDPLALLLGLLIVWTIAAFGEEMVFRGYVLNSIASVFAPKVKSRWLWAVILSSCVFGLGHIYQGWTGVILSGIAGAVYCGAYFLDGRCLWAPILIHGIYDTSVFLTLFFGWDKGLFGPGG